MIPSRYTLDSTLLLIRILFEIYFKTELHCKLYICNVYEISVEHACMHDQPERKLLLEFIHVLENYKN